MGNVNPTAMYSNNTVFDLKRMSIVPARPVSMEKVKTSEDPVWSKRELIKRYKHLLRNFNRISVKNSLRTV
jgi:hypothetical protein